MRARKRAAAAPVRPVAGPDIRAPRVDPATRPLDGYGPLSAGSPQLRYLGVDDQCLPPDIVARWAALGGRTLPVKATPSKGRLPGARLPPQRSRCRRLRP